MIVIVVMNQIIDKQNKGNEMVTVINFLIKFLMSIVLLLSPIIYSILGIGVLVGIDLIFGIMASVKKGEKFTSKRLKDSVVKLLVYNLLLIAGFVTETWISDWIPFTKIILSFLSIVEITSLGESFQSITGLSFVKFVKDYISTNLNKGKGNNKIEKKK